MKRLRDSADVHCPACGASAPRPAGLAALRSEHADAPRSWGRGDWELLRGLWTMFSHDRGRRSSVGRSPPAGGAAAASGGTQRSARCTFFPRTPAAGPRGSSVTAGFLENSFAANQHRLSHGRVWSPQLGGSNAVRRGPSSLAGARGHRAGFKDDSGLSGAIARFQSCTSTLGGM